MNIYDIDNNLNAVKTITNVTTIPNAEDEMVKNVNLLKQMTSGETFEGKVVKVDGSDIIVDIGGNNYVNARMNAAINLIEGQNIIFQVQNGNDNSVELRPLFTNLAQEKIAGNALNQAGIPVNAETLSMVSELMNNNMSIDKSSILSVYKNICQNPEVMSDRIVHMMKMGFDITPESVEIYDNICNLNDSFGNSVDMISSTIPDEIKNLINTGDFKAGMNLMQNCLSLVSDNPEYNIEVKIPVLDSNFDLNNTNAISEELQNIDDLSKSSNPEELLKSLMNNVIIEEDDSIVNILSNEAAKGDVSNIAASFLNDISINNPELFDKIVSSSIITEDSALNSDNSILQSDANVNLNAVFENITKAIRDNELTQNDIKALFENENFNVLLKNGIKDKWLLNIKDLGEGKSINDFYNDINSHIQQITSSMDKVLSNNTNLNTALNQMNQNLNFLNQMSQMMPYVQLPLKMNNESQTGDLFVYAKKKNLIEDNDNISALLRLDMKYLGYMEVFVKLNHQTNVTTDFCLENDDAIVFLENNMDKLTERLEKHGYTINATVSKKDIRENISKDFSENVSVNGSFGNQNKSDTIGHFRFDVRA